MIDITESLERLNSVYDYFIVGSDQVWNPLYGRLSNVDLLTGVANEKRVSYAASFGIENLPEEYRDKVEKELLQFRKISVREDIGKKIVEDITGRTDISVLIDPTMLLTADYWSKIVKRPGFHSEDKYVLLFFLGGVSSQNKEIIKNYAKQNNCKIINLLDKKSKYYSCDPSEFLFMEKNAQMVCTDSFHSTVFSILFNSSFTVFERISDNNMNSRLETLLEKFGLQSRVFMGEETLNNQTYDWENVNMKLNVEREYSFQYLKSALNIKG